MVGSSTWRLTNETAARNLQLTTLSYTPTGLEERGFDPNESVMSVVGGVLNLGRNQQDCNKNDFISKSKQPDVACIDSSLASSRGSGDGEGRHENSALVVRNGIKYYGSGNSCTSILKNFNMTVPKSTIYGLLGSSGCGLVY